MIGDAGPLSNFLQYDVRPALREVGFFASSFVLKRAGTDQEHDRDVAVYVDIQWLQEKLRQVLGLEKSNIEDPHICLATWRGELTERPTDVVLVETGHGCF